MDSLVLVVLRPHLPALGEDSNPALGLDNLPPQVIVAAVHIGDFFVYLLHGLDIQRCTYKKRLRNSSF